MLSLLILCGSQCHFWHFNDVPLSNLLQLQITQRKIQPFQLIQLAEQVLQLGLVSAQRILICMQSAMESGIF